MKAILTIRYLRQFNAIQLIRRTFLALLVLFVCARISSCVKSAERDTCIVQPKMFCPVFTRIQTEIPQRDLKIVKETPENELNKFQWTLGMAIRNEEGLWLDNDITKFFRAHGATHPDAMSYIMLIALSRELNGQNVDMERVTQHVVVELRPPPPPPPHQSNESVP